MINIFIVYFGKLPAHFDVWKQSVFKNQNVLRIILVTDQPVQSVENLYVIKSNLSDIRYRLHQFLSKHTHNIPPQNELITHVRKLCDIRVLCRYLFENDICLLNIDQSDHIGYGDLDVVYGDMKNFYHNAPNENYNPLHTYDVVGINGHMTVIRKKCDVWEGLFEGDMLQTVIYRMTCSHYSVFDEGLFRRYLMKHYGVNTDVRNEKWQLWEPYNDRFAYDGICNLRRIIFDMKYKDYKAVIGACPPEHTTHTIQYDSNKLYYNNNEIFYAHLFMAKQIEVMNIDTPNIHFVKTNV